MKKKTIFVREERVEKIKVGKNIEEVVRHVVKKYVMDDNQAQLIAMDKAFMLHGSYAPRDPKEAAQFGVKMIIQDVRGSLVPPMDIKPGMQIPANILEVAPITAENGNKNGKKKKKPDPKDNGH